ncbi:hypothetical protein EDC01DRAFT_633549 [Geopyxis carbonaria]|nr:hypothetical protein EDC01DRAFT_633549 [Geopyxis carbonaria]
MPLTNKIGDTVYPIHVTIPPPTLNMRTLLPLPPPPRTAPLARDPAYPKDFTRPTPAPPEHERIACTCPHGATVLMAWSVPQSFFRCYCQPAYMRAENAEWDGRWWVQVPAERAAGLAEVVARVEGMVEAERGKEVADVGDGGEGEGVGRMVVDGPGGFSFGTLLGWLEEAEREVKADMDFRRWEEEMVVWEREMEVWEAGGEEEDGRDGDGPVLMLEDAPTTTTTTTTGWGYGSVESLDSSVYTPTDSGTNATSLHTSFTPSSSRSQSPSIDNEHEQYAHPP